eukprot:1212736-Prymnesium_polylepis.1
MRSRGAARAEVDDLRGVMDAATHLCRDATRARVRVRYRDRAVTHHPICGAYAKRGGHLRDWR